MSVCTSVLSNNPCFQQREFPFWEISYLKASASEVLTKARDQIHLGWRLTHHPLYGNFQAKHQPYRTIILQKTRCTSCATSQVSSDVCLVGQQVDEMSLDLIECAQAVYAREDLLQMEQYPESLLNDCSYLDFALIETPLVQAGWPDISTLRAFFKHS